MIHTYEEALNWIHSRLRLGIKPGLKRMEWMMERLGSPEKNIKAIHVAGTNGKGSTVSYLRNILQESGYTVGTFTSPYIESFNERISVNGNPISDQEIVSLLNKIKPLADELENSDLGGPTEFEVITAMALEYFATNTEIDFVMMEVGLGGRLDSTNIITPLISIITNIGKDHMNILGETVAEIAFEKAGIIKSQIPVITTVEQKEALEVIKAKSGELESKMYIANQDYFIENYVTIGKYEEFSIRTPFHTFLDLQIEMKGAHQVKNASLAVMAISHLLNKQIVNVSEKHLRAGLRKTKWIGRFEQIISKPSVIIDGAHNPEGVTALLQTMNAHLERKRIHIIFSALKDKRLDGMIDMLATSAHSILFTSFNFPRASEAKDLYEICSTTNKSYDENWKHAVDMKIEQLTEDDVLVITGSLYFISEVRNYLKN